MVGSKKLGGRDRSTHDRGLCRDIGFPPAQATPIHHPSKEDFIMDRRKLFRLFAVAVAFAALTPLFAADRCGANRVGGTQMSAPYSEQQPR
jgi:hypothetical protein